MKRRIQFVFVVIFILKIARLAEAAPVGNPADAPPAGGWISGIEIEVLKEKDFSDTQSFFATNGLFKAESERYLWGFGYA